MRSPQPLAVPGALALALAASPTALAQCPRGDMTLPEPTGLAFDGATIAVGSPYVDGQSTQNGTVWVIDAQTGAHVTRLANPLPLAGSTDFGRALAIDGGRIAVGSPFAPWTYGHAGAVYVFDAATGGLLLQVVPPDGSVGDGFGTAVALQGNTLLVGSPGTFDGGLFRGAAYAYDVATGQMIWQLTSSTSSDYDYLGRSVALDGARALVGAPGDEAFGPDTGSAHLFDLTTGQEVAAWSSTDGSPTKLGTAVALSGGRAILGRSDGGLRVRDVATGVETLAVALPGKGDLRVMSLAVEGNLLLAGMPWDTLEGGSVHFVDLATGAVTDSLYRETTGYGYFGFNVAVSGGRVVVAAPTASLVAQYDVCAMVGAAYCDPAVDNSTGGPGILEARGSDVASTNDLTLRAASLPANQLSILLTSDTQDFVPNVGGGQGTLCVGGTIARFRELAGATTGAGTVDLSIDLTALPFDPPHAVMVGETWNFQLWYRDRNPTPTSNLTNAVAVLFQ